MGGICGRLWVIIFSLISMYIDSNQNILNHPLSSEQSTMIFKFAAVFGLAFLSALSVSVEAAAAASGDEGKMHGVLKEVVLKGVHSASIRGLQVKPIKKPINIFNREPDKFSDQEPNEISDQEPSEISNQEPGEI
jgi:hypothetical protein